ncbi:MAG: alkaline phosphatase family protein [Jatrophihabitans sp.]
MVHSSSMRRRLELSARLVSSWRPTGSRLRGLVRSMTTSYLALGITLYILPGRQSAGPLAVLGLVIVVAAVGVLLRPVLLGLAVVLGSFGLLLIGVLTQAIILDIALGIAPDVEVGSRPAVLLVSWVAATVAALVNWLFDAGNEDSFLAQLLGRAVRVAHRQPLAGRPAGPGTLIVQLDGVGEDLLRQAITAGTVPTLSRWLRSGSHRLRGWHTGLPATTPAGQAVLLYGDTEQVPSFRWYEKESGRLVVANHPRDAAEIEQRLSTGRGLLADGGVSVSNLFSGDAPTRLLTMSDARLPPRSTRGLASFATAKGGLVRSIVVFGGQVIAELYQGRRQRRRDVLPRVRRGGVFALVRGVTTALLRDLNVAIVAEQIARAAPVIFVDFLDYDEVAHHAGPSRPESMRTLDGLDRLLRFFAEVIEATGRDYDIVVVSDHGQAQGATFGQLSGTSLHELVSSLCVPAPAGDGGGAGAAGIDSAPAERWTPLNLLLTGVARSQSPAARVMSRTRDPEQQVTLGQPVGDRDSVADPAGLVVAAAGSLAHIYLAEVAGQVPREVIEARHPGLIDALAGHPQIGAVLVRSQQPDGLVVLGAHGWRLLDGSRAVAGSGLDPLSDYGVRAAGDLTALAGRRHVGDLIVLGRFDPASGEVVAFEELVGSHGGLGGGQTEAIFLHPAGWPVPVGVLSGLQVHRVLLERVRPVTGQAPASVGQTASRP